MENVYCVKRTTRRKMYNKTDGSFCMAFKLEHFGITPLTDKAQAKLDQIAEQWKKYNDVPKYVYKDNGEIYSWSGLHVWIDSNESPAFKIGKIKRDQNRWWIIN